VDDNTSENIWVDSLFLNNLLKGGVSTELGKASFQNGKATFEIN
jgi:hypothetical protein